MTTDGFLRNYQNSLNPQNNAPHNMPAYAETVKPLVKGWVEFQRSLADRDRFQEQDQRIGSISKAVEEEQLQMYAGPADLVNGLVSMFWLAYVRRDGEPSLGLEERPTLLTRRIFLSRAGSTSFMEKI